MEFINNCSPVYDMETLPIHNLFLGCVASVNTPPRYSSVLCPAESISKLKPDKP